MLTMACLLAVASPPLHGEVPAAVLEAQNRRIQTIEQVAPSVVAIFARGGQGGGSGVIITPDGYALTNFHVTSSAGDFMQCGLNDGRLYDAVIVGIDPTGDVALIKLLGRDDFPAARMGDSDTLRIGDWTFAMGNPFLLATDFQPTVTYGIVSGVHRYQYPAGTFLEYTDCIQIDTSINPGNSGGPLFNERGELVGINGRGSFEKRGRVNSGAGYAISINQIRNFMGHLRSGRIVDHATLGATVTTRDDGAVVVADILEHSDAYRRGLRIDDEIVSFAGRPIRSVNQFKNVLGIYPKGWKLPLVYRRDQQKHEILVRLRGLHRASELKPRRRGPRIEPRQPPKKPKSPDDEGKTPKDQDGKKKQPDDGKPKPQPPRRPARPRGPGAQIPEKYKHMLVKKEGFANFYFNQLEQDRVLEELQSWGDFSTLGLPWKITGTTQDGTPVEATIERERITLAFKGEKARDFVQKLTPESDLTADPPGSGGLLVALHHWRQMLTDGKKAFPQFYYLGTEPLDGDLSRMVDVIVSTQDTAESRWYFETSTGQFVGFDLYVEPDVDPCEVRFQGVRTSDGRRWPAALQVKSGEQLFATIAIESVEATPSETPNGD